MAEGNQLRGNLSIEGNQMLNHSFMCPLRAEAEEREWGRDELKQKWRMNERKWIRIILQPFFFVPFFYPFSPTSFRRIFALFFFQIYSVSKYPNWIHFDSSSNLLPLLLKVSIIFPHPHTLQTLLTFRPKRSIRAASAIELAFLVQISRVPRDILMMLSVKLWIDMFAIFAFPPIISVSCQYQLQRVSPEFVMLSSFRSFCKYTLLDHHRYGGGKSRSFMCLFVCL